MSSSVKNKYEGRGWIKILLITTFVMLILLDSPVLCKSHGQDDDNHHHYDHDHIEAPPSFEYSKQVNEQDVEQKAHGHVLDDRDHDHHHHKEGEDDNPDWRPLSNYLGHKGDMFIQAMGSTFLISCAPFFLLFCMPLDNTSERQPLLKIVLSFASGSLLGDAFLHLIPHASSYSSHDHKEGHEHSHDMSVGLGILAAIFTFLFVEQIIRGIKGDHGHHHHHHHEAVEQPVDIRITGYLNLAADFLHNFTDGLAIGASYLAGNSVGYMTTLTILLHEVPHEIGDFAILIQSGCSKRKAILLQLVTAIGALLGTFISLLIGGMGDLTTKWVLSFTAGGFIYIAAISVIPELLANYTTIWQSMKEGIAMFVGVCMMVLLAQYE